MKWNELLFNLVQIGLTVSLVALIPLALRRVLKKRYPARAMCIVWAVLALRLLVPIQLTLPEPPVQVTPRTHYLLHEAPAAPLDEGAVQVIDPAESRWLTAEQAAAAGAQDNAAVTTLDVSILLAVLWIAGGVVFFGVQVWGYLRYTRRLRRGARPVQSAPLRAVFDAAAQEMGVRRVPLAVSAAADCPMLAGFLRPTLYLPDENLSEQDAAFIFRHELTHYRHGDLWLKLLLIAARSMHWFNPLMHLMARFAQEDIELACDDAVARGMDSAARRAYGETILRSAVAQSDRRRALISCFTGDKETLMRRFEGLFDTQVKKRGMALVLAVAVLTGMLGCAFSVGEGEEKPQTLEARALGAALSWAQHFAVTNGQDWQGAEFRPDPDRPGERFDVWDYERFAVEYEPEDKTCTVVYEMRFNPERAQQTGYDAERLTGLPYRQAQRLHLEEDAQGELQVALAEWIFHVDSADTVDSLDDFRLLYENDLGLPDYSDLPEDVALDDLRTVVYALLGISADVPRTLATPQDQNGDGADDLRWCSLAFPDGSGTLELLLTDPFGRGWLPQDYTYNGGKNARTGMDLAGQYARGVMHKSGQFLYPILTAEKQQAFQTQQALPDGGFSWKYGGSSPSYDDAAVLPGRTQDEYIAVFRKTGGGMTDLRAAWAVTVGQEDGRSVITEVADCAQQDYTKSDLFKLYYNSALPQPTLPEGADHFNGAPLDRLYEPLTAAQAVFGWLGETAFTAELESSDENTAVVRLHFADNSPSVDVQMCKTDGYWLPDGLALQTEGVFRATAGDTPLPVGQTVRQAIAAAGGNVPLLQAGDKIELLFDPAPNGSVTIEDAVIRADGALQYSERETKRSTFDFTHAGTASLSYDYVAEPIMAQYLSSALTGAVYRGVTVSYPLADGTERTAAFVFRLANGARQDAAIHAADYHDPTYGYTLTLPDCFVEQGYAVPTENGVRFGLQNAMPGYSDDPTDAGTVMTLTAEATAVLKAQFGEDWLAEYPMPCKQLAERDGLTWYLIFASDVQYDPTDADIAAAYREMDQAARALDGSALSFEGQNAQQRTNAREQLLTGLAQYHGGLFRQKSEQTLAPVIRMAVTANADGNYADVAYEIPILRDGYPAQLRRKAERMWFDAAGSLAPTRREELADSGMKGMTMAGFLACYQNDLGMPIYDAEQVEALQRLYEDSSAEAYALLDTPEKGAKYALGLADAHGSFAGEAVYSPSDPCMVTFAFVQPDTNTPTGETLRIRMRPVAVDGSRPAVWLPEDFSAQGADGQTIGGLGYQFPPYDSRVYARAHQYYAYRDTADLVWYLDMGWTDGAYTEGVLAELEKRWKNDPQTVDSIVQRGGENVRALWASHKAVNPDIFGA